MVKYVALIISIMCCTTLEAQDSITPLPPDTAAPVPVTRPRTTIPRRVAPRTLDSTAFRDSFSLVKPLKPIPVSPVIFSDSFIFTRHPFYSFVKPVRNEVSIRQWQGKEGMFYAIIGLLFFFALIRNGFPRYISDLFKIFFRTTIKQRQIREQLIESPLPSLLLNIFFIISGGMFLALLLRQMGMGLDFNFWLLFGYCCLGLFLVYGIKFIALKLLGWIFQVREAIDAYVFIVFSTNKVIGMAILPFIVMLAFTYGFLIKAAVTLSLVLIGALFAYRYFLSYASIHRQVRMSFFHFFLYLCAFEVAPLLLINKLLFRLLGETT